MSHATALILDTKTKTCEPRLAGLVGLHVVTKTKQLPQWLWATFEQVDNAVGRGRAGGTGQKVQFQQPACTNCPVDVPLGAGDQTPTQVVRVVPVDSAAGTNSLYQAALQGLRPDNVGNTRAGGRAMGRHGDAARASNQPNSPTRRWKPISQRRPIRRRTSFTAASAAMAPSPARPTSTSS